MINQESTQDIGNLEMKLLVMGMKNMYNRSSPSPLGEKFESLGLTQYTGINEKGKKMYTLTPEGKEVYAKLRLRLQFLGSKE